jgi:hypothetical protein
VPRVPVHGPPWPRLSRPLRRSDLPSWELVDVTLLLRAGLAVGLGSLLLRSPSAVVAPHKMAPSGVPTPLAVSARATWFCSSPPGTPAWVARASDILATEGPLIYTGPCHSHGLSWWWPCDHLAMWSLWQEWSCAWQVPRSQHRDPCQHCVLRAWPAVILTHRAGATEVLKYFYDISPARPLRAK